VKEKTRMKNRSISRIVFDAVAEVLMLSLAFGIFGQVVHDNTTWGSSINGVNSFLLTFTVLGLGYLWFAIIPLIKKKKQVQE